MKKSLVALAVLSAVGGAYAQSVTLYGVVEPIINIGLTTKVDTIVSTTTAAGTTVVRSNSQSNPDIRLDDGNKHGVGTSRVGFRGNEDLGGGLKANFFLEMGLRIDDGCVTVTPGNTCAANSGDTGGNLFGRNAWGGLSGSFGEVRLGRVVNQTFYVQAYTWVGGASNGLFDVGASVQPPMGGVRTSNAIVYITPNMGGFQGTVQYGAAEATADASTGSATKANPTYDLTASYTAGPLYVGGGYNRRESGSSQTGTGAFNADTKIDQWTLGAAYDFKAVKVFANYTKEELESARSGAGALVSAQTQESFSLGVNVPLGTVSLLAGYAENKIEGASVSGTTAVAGTDSKVTGWHIGMQYPLSKRTMLEANYGEIKNDANTLTGRSFGSTAASFTLTNAVTTTNGFSFGMRHAF